MAASKDIEVVNLLQVGFLANLIGYAGRPAKAWEFMGGATRKLAKKRPRDMADRQLTETAKETALRFGQSEGKTSQ